MSIKIQSIKSENILQIYEIIHIPSILQSQICYVVAELCSESDLFTFQQKNNLHYQISLDIALQVSLGLSQLHQNGITHRDIKPENIFLSLHQQRIVAKIGDFGLCIDESLTQSVIGTISYMGPEHFTYSGPSITYKTNKNDVWAFGCILYELIENQQYFAGRTQMEIADKIRKFQQFDSTLPSLLNNEYLQKEISKIIKKCLIVDPEKRADASSIYNDLKVIIDTIKRNEDNLLLTANEQLPSNNSICEQQIPYSFQEQGHDEIPNNLEEPQQPCFEQAHQSPSYILNQQILQSFEVLKNMDDNDKNIIQHQEEEKMQQHSLSPSKIEYYSQIYSKQVGGDDEQNYSQQLDQEYEQPQNQNLQNKDSQTQQQEWIEQLVKVCRQVIQIKGQQNMNEKIYPFEQDCPTTVSSFIAELIIQIITQYKNKQEQNEILEPYETNQEIMSKIGDQLKTNLTDFHTRNLKDNICTLLLNDSKRIGNQTNQLLQLNQQVEKNKELLLWLESLFQKQEYH